MGPTCLKRGDRLRTSPREGSESDVNLGVIDPDRVDVRLVSGDK